jgi:hypothetical protein
MYPSIKQKLMQEIDLLPENKLAEVYNFAHYLRLGVKKQNRKNDEFTGTHLLPEEINHSYQDLKSEILEIGKYCSSLPLLDGRAPDDILGYDSLSGIP